MFKCALVSVSDKQGLVEFLKPYVQQGMKVVSTGGTFEHLKSAGLNPVEISQWTGFPEVMGGRVKTLHPKVHMGLLARTTGDSEHLLAEDANLLKQYEISAFDLVVCNLYPFEAAVLDGKTGADLIEKIDVGGPTMLRAAAKNFSRIAVVCDPQDYAWVTGLTKITKDDRKKLASKVFAHTAVYDSLIAQSLNDTGEFSYFPFGGVSCGQLRYGENPQQKATWYRAYGNNSGLHTAQILQGKALSYNNILDLDAALRLVNEFQDPTCVAVKHNNPCGVATQRTILSAIEKSFAADPVSVFGGIVALNREVGLAEAEELQNVFLGCIVAPSYSREALEAFAKKKNLRILKLAPREEKISFEFRSVLGGFLVQDKDQVASASSWQFIGEKPSPEILQDLQFAEKVCASLKSNAISIVEKGQSLGLGMGQVNRVDAVSHAITRMKTHHPKAHAPIMASDAFFPFPDSVELAANAGVKWILQPGGSIKDAEVFESAKKNGINMVITGARHFRH